MPEMQEETARLRIRAFTLADAEEYFDLESDPEEEYHDDVIYGVLRREVIGD